MSNLKFWLMAIRPKTLTASTGPVILGLALHYHLNAQLNYITAIFTLLCALFLQISTNLINDYYDGTRGTDTEERLGPTRVTSSQLIPANKVKQAFILTLLISFIFGIYLMIIGGLPIIVIGLSSLLFAYLYTGGPYPLSHYGLGEVLAFIFFGPVAVWGTYYIQSGAHSYLPILVGAGPGFISAALMAINNLRDQNNDRDAQKTTVAVIVGETASRYLPVLLIILSIMVPVFFYNFMRTPISVLLVCVTPFLFINSWQFILNGPISSQMNESLASTGKYLFVYCIIFSLSLNNPFL